MKLSVTAPAPAGCALIRDVRCWHGGTPNCTRSLQHVFQRSTIRLSRVYAVRLCQSVPDASFCLVSNVAVQCLAKFEPYRLQHSTRPGTSHRLALRVISARCLMTLGAGGHFSNGHSAHPHYTVSLFLFLCLSARGCRPRYSVLTRRVAACRSTRSASANASSQPLGWT